VAFYPTGTIVAGSDGSTVWLWNPATGRETGIPMTATTHGMVIAIAFSPSGTTLATAVNDGTVQLWNTGLWTTPYRTLCAEAGAPTATDWSTYAPGEPQPAGCT
jgi:WD40 repeat protein